MPFDQLYWPARSMNHTLGNKEFDEEDFFVSGPTRLAFQSQSITGRKNRTLGTTKVALLDAFGNVMTVDSASTVTLTAVTAAGDVAPGILISIYGSQSLVDRAALERRRLLERPQVHRRRLVQAQRGQQRPGVPEEKSLPISISN